MITWFGILVLVFAILLTIVVIVNIFYANRIREGGTLSSGTSALLMWLNVFALIFLIVLIIVAIYYLVARPRTVRICGQQQVKVKQAPPVVTTTETVPVQVVHQVPVTETVPVQVTRQINPGQVQMVQQIPSNASFYTTPGSAATVTRLEESTY